SRQPHPWRLGGTARALTPPGSGASLETSSSLLSATPGTDYRSGWEFLRLLIEPDSCFICARHLLVRIHPRCAMNLFKSTRPLPRRAPPSRCTPRVLGGES